MNALTPLESLFEMERGPDLPLPPELSRLFGRLQFPPHPGSPGLSHRPYVIGNFVTTLDGVVALGEPGTGGGEISGFNTHDHMLMGLLRATSDAIIVGARTLKDSQDHLWTAEYIFPALSEPYQALRRTLGKPKTPLNVIVTANGTADLALPVFQSGEVAVLIVTTTHGEERIRKQPLPSWVQVLAVQDSSSLSAHSILEAVNQVMPTDLVLVEGGPQLMGHFFAEQTLDELFLTLSPQIAGRDDHTSRPGLVTGQLFAPEHPLWGTLIGIKRAGSHLFLRYAFAT